MGGTKVTTVIVNQTEQGMTLKEGNRNCYAKLTSVKEQGGEYRMQALDINWTYQEFLLEDKRGAHRQLFLNSDDCCDYERIIVTELPDGQIVASRDPRKHFNIGGTTVTSDIAAAPSELLVPTKAKKPNSWCRFWHLLTKSGAQKSNLITVVAQNCIYQRLCHSAE